MDVATASASLVLSEGNHDTDGKGPVHGAQWLLSGHNVFKENYRPGTIDGRFGESTGQACVRAKTALGYPERGLEPVFGPQLRAYLLGETPLSAAYAARRKTRQKAAQPAQTYIYPGEKPVRLIGRPGQGTHSWTVVPNNWQSDNAWDFAFPFGTALLAVADGVVGDRIGAIDPDPKSRFGGLRCYLKTADNEFYYAHLSTFAPVTKPGAKLKQGDVIGFSGSASGVEHLHLGCRDWRAFEATAEGPEL